MDWKSGPILPPSLCPRPLRWDPEAPLSNRWTLVPYPPNQGRLRDLLWPKEWGRRDSVSIVSLNLKRLAFFPAWVLFFCLREGNKPGPRGTWGASGRWDTWRRTEVSLDREPTPKDTQAQPRPAELPSRPQLTGDAWDSVAKTRDATQLICGPVRDKIWLLFEVTAWAWGRFLFCFGFLVVIEKRYMTFERIQFSSVYFQRCQNRNKTVRILSSCLIFFFKDPNHTSILKLNSNTRSSNTIS